MTVNNVEKVLKAIILSLDVRIPRTHSIAFLLEIIEKEGIEVPDDILKSTLLTEYAVMTRYPGNYEIISDKDFEEALTITKTVFNWAIQILDGYKK